MLDEEGGTLVAIVDVLIIVNVSSIISQPTPVIIAVRMLILIFGGLVEEEGRRGEDFLVGVVDIFRYRLSR